jgi:hypothetical protein
MGSQEGPALFRASVGAIVLPGIVLRIVFEKRAGKRTSDPFPMYSLFFQSFSGSQNNKVSDQDHDDAQYRIDGPLIFFKEG